MTCPLCNQATVFRWYTNMAGEEWAECTLCNGQTDQAEIDAANREGIPTLTPIRRRVQLPHPPEWEPEPAPTRLDVHAGCPHPGRPGSDWLRDLIDGVFAHADRIQIETWTFPEEDAA
jgi:hypothetical protein